MEIKVFGPGCAKCKEAEQLVRNVAATKNSAVNITKVSDFKEMMSAGVLSTPAVSVDGVLKVAGRIPTKDEIESWLDNA